MTAFALASLLADWLKLFGQTINSIVYHCLIIQLLALIFCG